jgi:hypothetical protein
MLLIHLNNKSNTAYEVFFDWTGNVYLKSQKTEKIYQIYVDTNNNIILIDCNDMEFSACDIGFKQMKLTSEPSSLKGKIQKEDETKDKDVNKNDSHIEDILYPEENEYYEDDDEIYSDDDLTDSFNFSKINSEINIYSTDESTSIYDTFVYNGSYQYNSLIIKTSYNGYSLPYRLLIYTSGEFIIKTIGQSQWYNQLSELNDEPYFINSKNDKIKL